MLAPGLVFCAVPLQGRRDSRYDRVVYARGGGRCRQVADARATGAARGAASSYRKPA